MLKYEGSKFNKKINAKSFISKTIYFNCFYMIFINFICEFLRLPTIIRYIPDLFLPIYIFYCVTNIKQLLNNKQFKILFIIIFIFFVHCCIGNFMNFTSLFYFIWGFRNIFRFLIISLCSILVFEERDKNRFIKSINVAFIINIIVCLIQYYVLGYWGDAIGGTFRLGNTGGNSGLIYLIIIENTIVVINYLTNNDSLLKLLFVMCFSLFIARIAELKIIYLCLIIIVFISILINKFSIKKLLIILFTIIIFIFGSIFLNKIDPDTAKMMNSESLIEYAGGESHGYSSDKDISRLRAFSQIDNYFFSNNILKKSFGYGLGNCDISSFDIFNTNFAEKYDSYLHYTWFTHAMLYLETGIIGYIVFLSFFIYIIIYCFKIRNIIDFNLCNAVIVVGVLSTIMTFYNSTLRNDISYFIYIFMVFPLAISRRENSFN